MEDGNELLELICGLALFSGSAASPESGGDQREHSNKEHAKTQASRGLVGSIEGTCEANDNLVETASDVCRAGGDTVQIANGMLNPLEDLWHLEERARAKVLQE